MLLSCSLQFVIFAPSSETDAAWDVHCRNCVSACAEAALEVSSEISLQPPRQPGSSTSRIYFYSLAYKSRQLEPSGAAFISLRD